MPEGNIRHMYPGGNTPSGFFSYYDYIIPVTEAKRFFIFKGGPGTGKSTLMRKIGLEYSKKGYDIEFMHCSSDNNSLDGIVIPKLKIAMVDGTAPHIVEPIYPGAVDEIVNLGNFWDIKGFEDSKAQIFYINKKIKGNFTRAYRYLKAASALKEDTEVIYNDALNMGEELYFTQELTSKLLGEYKPSRTFGQLRRMFASAITPRGFTDYLDSICSDYKIIRLSAPTGSNTRNIIDTLKNEALIRGFYAEAFYCPMDPEKIEHLIIPDLKLSVITANVYHDISDINSDRCTTYPIDELYDKEKIESFSKQLNFNSKNTEILLQHAINCIAQAKNAHDDLERLYIKNMDFEGLTQLSNNLIKRIMSYT